MDADGHTSGSTPSRVTLTDPGRKKVRVIKEIRGATGMDLKAAKELVDAAPSDIVVSSQGAAVALAAALTGLGARVEVEEALAGQVPSGPADLPGMREAESRMNWTAGSRREIKKLGEHLWPGERVEEMTSGYYGGGTGLVVLTDRRLLFLKDGWIGKTSEDFPRDKVSSVQYSSGLLLGKITVFASGNKAEIENVNKADGKRIVDNMRARHAPEPSTVRAVASVPESPTDKTAAWSSEQDPIASLKRLGELRAAGVITEEEFQAKKADLLSRI
jgi:hypothetical protein